MACRIIRNQETNDIKQVLAPNGKESKLFIDILEKQPDKEKALRLYAQVYSPTYKAKFGDWESKGYSYLLDENGEPFSYGIDYGNLNPRDVQMSPETSVNGQKEEIGQRVLNSLADKLSENLGIKYQLVSPQEARAITENAKVAWNGEKAFFYNGEVYLLKDGFNMDNILHEYSHPLVSSVYEQNPVLFNNLYTQLASTEDGKNIISEVQTLYPELDQNDSKFSKEIMVRALSKEASNNINGVQSSNGLMEFINKFIFAVKQMLRKVFGTKINIDKLSTKTSIKELADMLVGDKFQIDTELVSEGDYVEFARDVTEFVESLNDVSNSDISLTVKRFYDLTKNQIRRIRQNANYSDARNLLINDETKSGLLQGIKRTLDNTSVDPEFIKELTEVETREKDAVNFVHSILQLDILTKKIHDHLKELAKGADTQEVLSNIFYYDLLVQNWSTFVNETNQRLFDEGLDPSSKLGQTLATINNRLEAVNRLINKSYTPGVIDVLSESLDPLKRGIDEYYSNWLEKSKAKNASQKLIDKINKQWDESRITKERLEDLLSGKLGDTNVFSVYAEAYSNSPDNIVGGFAMFLKNAYNKVDAQAQRNYNDLLRDMEPLLNNAGYSRSNYVALMEKLVFKDNKTYYDTQKGELVNKEVYTMLNQFKNTEANITKLKHDFEQATDTGNKEEADRIIKELRQHLKDYFHQDYVDDFYKREEIYNTLAQNTDLEDVVYRAMGVDKDTATPEQKVAAADMYEKAAKDVYRKKYTILNTIREIDGQNYEEEYFEQAAEEKKILWREYAQIASLTDLNGNPKIADDMVMAAIERKYRVESSKFYEWKPIQGLFEFNLDKFEQNMIDGGIPADSEEFTDKRNKWIKNNTVISYTQDYYEERNNVLTRLKSVLSNVPENVRKNIDSTGEMKELLDMVTGFRDQDGQILGNDIALATKLKMKDLQQAITDKKLSLAGFSGLTKDEMEETGGYYEKIISKQKLTPDERFRFNELIDRKNTLGVDKATQAEIQALFKRLGELQSKEATDYYVDIANNWMEKLGREPLDNDTASDLLTPEVYTKLFAESPEYEAWFKENHIAKEVYDKTKQKNVIVYDRVFIWNRTRPNNPDHYETIGLASGETIMGKPNLSYFYRLVKPEYRTEKVVGKTVDNKGNWLPKTLLEGAKDDLYINQEYDKLRQGNPAAFAVLEKMKEYHLKFQEGIPRESKLYLEIPRYRKQAIELKPKNWWENIKQNFVKRNDDFQDGLNFNPGQLVHTDMFDEQIRKIPITGTYNLTPDEVSLNILDGMNHYMYSGLHQKKLIELNPMAQALKAVVNDPANAVQETKKFIKHLYKSTGKLVPVKNKNLSNRARAINNMIEREFEGVKIADFSRNMPALHKFKQMLSRVTSLGIFALNIPSAIKNRQAAVIEGFIEASGGRFLSLSSYAKGKLRAWQIMKNSATEIYATKTKSLDVQLLQIFDPGQDYFKRTVGHQFGRSIASDTANLSFLMAPRHFLQYQATLETWAGILHHIKVPQTINGETREIDYINAWEIRNGQIELKPGVPEEYAAGNTKFNEIKNKTHEIANRLEGTYNQFDQPELNRYFIFQSVAFLKKYFTSMAMNHVAARRPSAALGTISAGNYSNLLYFAKGILQHGPKYYNFMNEEESRALRKTAAHMSSIIFMYMLLNFAFDYDDEDKNRFEKMKKRSGNAFEESFKLDGWLVNQAAWITLATLSEEETWSNPSIMINTVKGLPQPSALFNLGLKSPYNVLKHTYGAATGDQGAFYKKDVGPYFYQKKGGSKAVAEVAKIFGFTGSTVDPAKAIKTKEAERKGIY